MALYDAIGRTYDATRRADPEISDILARLIEFMPGARYLDVASGTGNYTIAFANRGARLIAAELSATMLAQARAKGGCVDWTMADAEKLPFGNGKFDGAMCTLAIHHMRNPAAVFREVFRVMRSGRFVIFTADRDQMEGYWLNEYFPSLMARGIVQMPPLDAVETDLRRSGFDGIVIKRWSVSETLEDLFLYAGKFRPEIYLDSVTRAGISTFASYTDKSEIERGLKRLDDDVKSGRFAEVADFYRNELGDYAFVAATKE
ncbi:MAG TPA: methyltransferase domain-containing protein [Candidatus Binataceae bacterium]|nr:methyltransferase domain-containing protein [Candidatus Binataceae bacterium]